MKLASRRMALRMILVMTSLGLGLLILEFGLAVWYGVAFRPGPYEVVSQWDSPFVFRVKSEPGNHNLGIRNQGPVDVEKPEGVFRILSYGDSVAGGYGIETEEMYAAVAESRLRADENQPVEILSMLRGHSPSVYLFHMRTDVPRLKPDAIVVEVELLNDVSDEARVSTSGEDAYGLPTGIESHRYLLNWNGHIISAPFYTGTWLDRTTLFAKVTRWYGRVREKLSPNPLYHEDSDAYFYGLSGDRYRLTPEVLSDGYDRLFDALSGMHEYATENGLRFLVLLVPSRYVFSEEAKSASSRAIVARAEESARDRGLPFVNLTQAISQAGGSDLYQDFCHPTAGGNAAMGAELASAIEEWLQPRPQMRGGIH